MKKLKFVGVIGLIFLYSCQVQDAKYRDLSDGLYVDIQTDNGDILLSLDYKNVPITVGNFVSLAEGTNMRVTDSMRGKPFYNGMVFHRVISKTNGNSNDFMVQGGDPLANGLGDAGYKFIDEFPLDSIGKLILKHNGPGVLSMANSGPATNGSQFYITHIATDWLDNKHTVFGNVIEGQEIVDAVSQGDTLESIEIVRVGEDAEKFNAIEAFRTFEGSREKREADAVNAQNEILDKESAGFDKTNSGLRYKILQNGNGKQAAKGDMVSVHYKGQLLDGTVFDSSYKRKQPLDFNVGLGQVISGWDEGIQLLKVGDKARFVIPSELAYGSQGAGSVIPPDAPLIFDVELVNVK